MLSNEDLILRNNFLKIKTRKDLANVLKIKLSTLTYFLNNKRKSQHYKVFTISKRNNSKRIICAPQHALKQVLKNLNYILNLIYPPKPSVHGFVKTTHLLQEKRGITTNALKHTNRRYVLNIDLEDFFPSIKSGRIRGLFEAKPFCFSREIALDIASLCTYNNSLPQGAPTSPILSNMICRKMDNDLQNLAQACKCTYTRYADDITFSTNKRNFPSELSCSSIKENRIIMESGTLLHNIIIANGFEINEKKTRLQNYTTKQEVTGLIVNKKVNVNRKYIKQIRAILHDWSLNGVEKACENYNKHKNEKLSSYNPQRKTKSFQQVIQGKIEFIGNVRGKEDYIYAKYYNQFNKLMENYKKHIPENDIEKINKYLWILFSESTYKFGTAFSLDNGNVISCSHCIESDTVAYKADNPNEKYKIKLLKNYNVTTGIDIAVFNILDKDERNFIKEKGFSIGDPNKSKQGDNIKFAGYSNQPTEHESFSKINFVQIASFKNIPCNYVAEGELRDIAIRRILVPVSILQGDSGGPVFNSNNEVIGIVAKGISDNRQIKEDASFEIIPIDAIYL